jgi:hypothetical protein
MLIVKNTEPRVHSLGGFVTLLPGVNEVDEAAWERALSISIVQHYVDEGVFVVAGSAKGKPGEAAAIAGMSVGEAKKLVGETVDLQLLRSWESLEERKGVQSSITAQITKVESAVDTKPPATEDDGTDLTTKGKHGRGK